MIPLLPESITIPSELTTTPSKCPLPVQKPSPASNASPPTSASAPESAATNKHIKPGHLKHHDLCCPVIFSNELRTVDSHRQGAKMVAKELQRSITPDHKIWRMVKKVHMWPEEYRYHIQLMIEFPHSLNMNGDDMHSIFRGDFSAREQRETQQGSLELQA
ncbi:uncharacterized protein BDV17DRAFT_259324 [Aspergillus undulatus]|uniref:uncharacterized protein n=1 Tax=Aspergillus undulatus TaxID=1810928 RepID=UPI003CCD0331